MLGKAARITSEYHLHKPGEERRIKEQLMNEPIHVTDAAFEKTVLTESPARHCGFLGALVRTLQDGRPDPGKSCPGNGR